MEVLGGGHHPQVIPRTNSKAFEEHIAKAPCDGKVGQLQSDWLSFRDSFGGVSLLLPLFMTAFLVM